MLVFVVLVFLELLEVNCHSWVACSDYKAEITGRDYDQDECSGWIRGWTFDGVSFGDDRGVNYQVGLNSGQSLCQRDIQGSDSSANAYSSSYTNSEKLASYTPGSTIRVVWPAKNHANYECYNFIPDTSMKLYMNPNPNPTSDLANDDTTMTGQGYTLVKDWHEDCTPTEDGCGFQNCPKFCENTDRATCYGDFTVPSVTQSGYYTFVWYWIFNPGSPYISCWEAYIDADSTEITAPTDESGGSDSDSDSVNGYLVQMPVCITGQDYDSETESFFISGQFSDVDSSDVVVIDLQETSNAYNYTVQFSLEQSELADVTTIASDEYCSNFENTYSGTTCDNCADVIIFALYDDGKGSTVNSFFSIVVTCLVLFFVV